jgi:hypothetical protein
MKKLATLGTPEGAASNARAEADYAAGRFKTFTTAKEFADSLKDNPSLETKIFEWLFKRWCKKATFTELEERRDILRVEKMWKPDPNPPKYRESLEDGKVIVYKLKMDAHKDYGDLFTLEGFLSYVESGGFTDDDGTGFYATATQVTNQYARPSAMRKGDVDTQWSHVMWYNK